MKNETKEFKGTKGEWRTTMKSSGIYDIIDVLRPSGADDTVCRTDYHEGFAEEAEANAKLIAAAPTMLASLIEIAEGKGRYSVDQFEHARNTIEDMKELAKAAIKKALD